MFIYILKTQISYTNSILLYAQFAIEENQKIIINKQNLLTSQ